MMSLFAILAAAVAAAPTSLWPIQNLVSFGDSYTDEARARYFMDHNGQAPPIGQLIPPSNNTASGGYAWGRFVANETGATYYDYAVGGAMCSQNIVPRQFFGGPFPDVLEYEVPTYEKEVLFPGLYPNRFPWNTVYTLWVGTNDLGTNGFLGDRQRPGFTLDSYMECIWSVFDRIYASGGRQFVLINQAPLEEAPMYATPSKYGRGNTRYWENPSAYNTTEFAEKIREFTTAVNSLFAYGVPYNLIVKQRWKGATFSVFDVHSLMVDMIDNPGEYFDAPADVKAPFRNCLNGCTTSPNPPSSFFW